ncbi:hypothetical protein EAF04_000424 [Stromatinia cepivora]|nr:hypothetical protein EAF04_000424 [Stromatinia cepivora]
MEPITQSCTNSGKKRPRNNNTDTLDIESGPQKASQSLHENMRKSARHVKIENSTLVKEKLPQDTHLAVATYRTNVLSQGQTFASSTMHPGSQYPTQTKQLSSYPQRVAQADIPPIINNEMPQFPVQAIQSSLCPQRSVQYTFSSLQNTGMPQYLAQATQFSLYCQCQTEATQSSTHLQHQAQDGAYSTMIPRNFQQPT